MICAVMQPYIFPYLGYYQLVQASDVFIFYDDVTYIKQGYINRNSILANGAIQRFTIPVLNPSSNAIIHDLDYGDSKKILKTFDQAYSRSLNFKDIFPIIEQVLTDKNRSISHINRLSVELVFEYLGIDKIFKFASELDYNRDKDRADRLIELSKIFECDTYLNSMGGREMYTPAYFEKFDIKLGFIENHFLKYQQLKTDVFSPHLSIIDILMSCTKDSVIKNINNYKVL